MEKQVNQEYDNLKELLQDNSYMIAESGESVTNVTKEEPVAPVEVLHNNVRNKKLKAEEDMDRYTKAVGVVQKKLSEKKAALNGHKQRYVMLDNKKTQLLGQMAVSKRSRVLLELSSVQTRNTLILIRSMKTLNPPPS